MFHSVASPDWKPGQPLTPAGALLFRTDAEAAAFAPDAVVVTVAVRYDAASRLVRPSGAGASVRANWSAPAVENRLGAITVFAVIPAALIRSTATATAAPIITPCPRIESPGVATEFHGWDSLTMALLA